MTMVTIQPLVELGEARALAEHWRNRALVQAQAAADLRAELSDRLAEIAGLQATLAAATTNEAVA